MGKGLKFPHPHQHIFSIFWIIATVVDVRCGLTVVLICISLMTNDEHPSMSLLAIRGSSLEKYLFKSFGHFLIELSVFSFWSYSYIFWILNLYQII